jgi:hypothetical protein
MAFPANPRARKRLALCFVPNTKHVLALASFRANRLPMPKRKRGESSVPKQLDDAGKAVVTTGSAG